MKYRTRIHELVLDILHSGGSRRGLWGCNPTPKFCLNIVNKINVCHFGVLSSGGGKCTNVDRNTPPLENFPGSAPALYMFMYYISDIFT